MTSKQICGFSAPPTSRLGQRIALVLLSLAGGLPAQTGADLFMSGCRAHLGWDPPDYSRVYFTTNILIAGDVNGDGNLDLIAGKANDQNRLLIGDGRGRFVDATATSLPAAWEDTLCLALGDVDGDGDLDLVEANYGYSSLARAYDQILLNDGQGRFAQAPPGALPLGTAITWSLLLADMDGDGDLDLVRGTRGIQPPQGNPNSLHIEWLRNDGKGRFSLAGNAHWNQWNELAGVLAAGDLDGDGDVDLVAVGAMSSSPYGIHALQNLGQGRYQESLVGFGPSLPWEAIDLALSDVDRDGDIDLLACYRLGYETQPAGTTTVMLLLNDGRGRFTDATYRNLPILPGPNQACRLLPADMDGDGDPDLIVKFFNYAEYDWPTCYSLLINDGRGTFLAPVGEPIPPSHLPSPALAAGDLDGDGDLDLIDPGQLLFNAGRGIFIAAGPNVAEGPAILGIADLDGDGDPDLVTSRRILRNDGGGRFHPGPAELSGLYEFNGWSLLPADVDGDQDVDLLAGFPTKNSLRLLRNDGRGGFTGATALLPSHLPGEYYYTGLVGRDVDGDRDVDLFLYTHTVMAALPAAPRLLLNDGSGAFADAPAGRFPNIAAALPEQLIPVDVDADGDHDLVGLPPAGTVSSFAAPLTLYLNDGTGRFQEDRSGRLGLLYGVTLVAAADVDEDGDPDLVVHTEQETGSPTRTGTWLFLNDGRGTFRSPANGGLLDGRNKRAGIRLADLDGDGHLDLLLSNVAPGSCFPWLSRLYLGDGRGGFVERGCGGVLDWLPPFPADLDGDGDLDLAGPNGIFWNLTRQACAPFLARLGHGYRLDFYARSPASTLARPVLPLVGLSRRRTPLGSLGTLGLDPARPLFFLPPIATDPVLGMVSLAFPIPADPALTGAELHFQALVAEGAAGPWRLTNVVSDTVFSL